MATPDSRGPRRLARARRTRERSGDPSASHWSPSPPAWCDRQRRHVPAGGEPQAYGGGFRLAAQRAGRARHRFRLAFDVEDRMRKLPDGQQAQAWNVQIMRVAGGAARQLLADSAAGWRRSIRSAFAASSFPT